jgi:hypothetical protein
VVCGECRFLRLEPENNGLEGKMGLTSRYQWHQRKKARKIFMSLSVQALLTHPARPTERDVDQLMRAK